MPDMLNRLSTWANRRRKLVWLMLFLLVVVVLVVVLTPVFLIMPFKAQTPRMMEVSYLMRRWSPRLTVLVTLLMLTIAIRLWIGGRWLFNPLPNPAYAKAADATFVNGDDRVLAVTINGESVAYPIRLMGYHHVVEDTVGGTPIVATY